MGSADRLDGWLRRHRVIGDSLLALALAVPLGATVTGPFLQRPGLGPALPLLVTLVSCAALVARRVRPEVSFGVVVAVHAIQFVLVPSLSPANITFPVSLYAVAAYGRPAWRWAGLGIGAVAAMAAPVRYLPPSVQGRDALVTGAVLGALLGSSVLAAWSLGSFRRVRTRYLATVEAAARATRHERAEQARRAVAEERARIAREVHDALAHSLAVIVVQADGGRYAAEQSPDAATEALETVARTARSALAEVRAVLGVLRSAPDGHPGGSGAVLPAGVADIPGLVAGTDGGRDRVRYEQHGDPRSLPPGTDLTAYRIVQEALTNALRHGGPAVSATVVLNWQDDAVEVTIRDDGRPVPGDPAPPCPGQGLIGMRERVVRAGGTLIAGPGPTGFRVVARLPYVHVPGEP